jgi:hypothetical protein
MYWPDRASVETGNVTDTGDVITSFTAYKKNGRWIIDESSVEKNRGIVTSDNLPRGDAWGLTGRCS